MTEYPLHLTDLARLVNGEVLNLIKYSVSEHYVHTIVTMSAVHVVRLSVQQRRGELCFNVRRPI